MCEEISNSTVEDKISFAECLTVRIECPQTISTHIHIWISSGDFQPVNGPFYVQYYFYRIHHSMNAEGNLPH